MKIIEIKVLRGPNYWSVRRNKLIQMQIDLEDMEQRPTNRINGFRQRLEKLLPSMYSHRCSVGTPEDFLKEWKKEPGWDM
jgi:cyanophycin synthetase